MSSVFGLQKLNQQDLTEQTKNEKHVKKERLMRSGFKTVGKYGIPLVKKQAIATDADAIELWGYVKTRPCDEENKHKTIHFFTYDWFYENVYYKPETALEKLDQYYALLTPDFSIYVNMPLSLQIYSTFKSRWCGAFWQKQGMRVIPTINWGSPESYEFCFDGVEQGSVVAVSTYCMEESQKEFMPGYNMMLEVLKPSAILCYGEPFKSMSGNIKTISPYNHEELIRKLGVQEYLKKFMEGNIYPSN